MARLRGDYESPLARPHGKRKRPRRPWGAILFSTLLVLLLGTGIAARFTLVLAPPHTVFASLATLTAEKKAALDQELELSRPADRDQAIDFALSYTAESLTLAPFSQRTPSFEFGVGKRPGNSAEHAALFVAVLEAAAKRVGSSARAERVESPLRVFKKAIPLPGFAVHDWVLVYDPADGARIFLDPTLSDAWLGATLGRNVQGGSAIPLPPEEEKRGNAAPHADVTAK